MLEYCQLAPASNPDTTTVALLVIRSLPELPVSAARARAGAAGAALSIVKAANEVLAALVLPATSVWRTRTWPAL